MSELSRRSMLKQVSAGTLAAVTAAGASSGESGPVCIPQPVRMLRPRAVLLPGFHAYASAHSIAAGETVKFYVSSDRPYRLSVVRLGPAIDDRRQDELQYQFPEQPSNTQAIHPGSCVIVERGLPASFLQQDFAIEFWIRPFLTNERQAVLAQKLSSGSFAIHLSDKKELLLIVGDATLLTSPPLPTLAWTHVVLNCTDGKLRLWLDGEVKQAGELTERPELSAASLLIGAVEKDGELNELLDADLAQPAVYSAPLSEQSIARRFADRGQTTPASEALLGYWGFAEEQGETVADSSRHERVGRIVNQATWMIGGPGFDGKNVARFGNEYDPKKDSLRGHALRLASDDLYDAGWQATHQWEVPDGARPGLYCLRADFEVESKPKVHFTTFLVRKPDGQPKAPLLVLCSSNTWVAYNSTPFSKNLDADTAWFASTAGGVNVDPRAPAYSCYLNHRGGQPAYQFGLRMPWPVAGPDVWYSGPEMGYSHLMRGERFTHLWLEQNGYDFDLVTDLDLHQQPELLRDRKAILINGHSEYWSTECYETVDRFLRNGGAAIVFSGNTMFWRVSFNSAGTVMECRKLDNRIGGMTHATVGELYHTQDGKRGSLMRECGLAAWQNIGLECDGWGGITPAEFGVYHTELPGHFLFHEPNEVGLKQGETFGHAPGGGVPRAIGHEWDVRLARLKSYTSKIPPGVSLPEEPEGIVTLARGVRTQTHALDYFTEQSSAPDGTVAEMIYWERPQGGKVFHGGAIAVGWALSADPKLHLLIQNVLHHFGVEQRK